MGMGGSRKAHSKPICLVPCPAYFYFQSTQGAWAPPRKLFRSQFASSHAPLISISSLLRGHGCLLASSFEAYLPRLMPHLFLFPAYSGGMGASSQALLKPICLASCPIYFYFQPTQGAWTPPRKLFRSLISLSHAPLISISSLVRGHGRLLASSLEANLPRPMPHLFLFPAYSGGMGGNSLPHARPATTPMASKPLQQAAHQ